MSTKVFRRRQLVAALITPVACLGLSAPGCGKDSGDQGIPSYVISALQHAPEGQRKAIEDGRVSPAEYEAAVLGTMSCLDAHGLAHDSPRLVERKIEAPIWVYHYGPYPLEEKEQAEATFQACYEEYEQFVAAVWVQQEGPSEMDITRAQNDVIECARERGIDVKSYEQLAPGSLDPDASQVVDDCKREVFGGTSTFP